MQKILNFTAVYKTKLTLKMRNSTFLKLFSLGAGCLFMLSSCKDDSFLNTPPPVPNQSFVEEFDTLSSAVAKGWVLKNRSVPVGIDYYNGINTPVAKGNWFQPSSNLFPIISVLDDGFKPDVQFFGAYSTRATNYGFLMDTYYATNNPVDPDGEAVISDWVISPVIMMQNGDKISFYTRAALNSDGTDFIDRLQVRINLQDESTDCGLGTDPGKFNTALLDVNAFQVERPNANGFPSNWTKFVATVSGINGQFKRARFAFRYYVPGGGMKDSEQAFGIGLDKVTYTSKGY